MVFDDQGIKSLGIQYFKKIFVDDHMTNIVTQLKVIRIFPSFICPEEKDTFTGSVTLSKVEAALKTFKKDKSPGPDGWPVEFYLAFCDLLGPDLVNLVETSRRLGRVVPSLNSTFIALIPKKYLLVSFADFRPLSLCNLVYKLISKVAALRLKPFLDKSISPQQFVFLKNRQIIEPLAITQEVLHTVKTKNRCALILKLDLTKAFDSVNWTFSQLILIQIGVPLVGVNWILGCISSANFSM